MKNPAFLLKHLLLALSLATPLAAYSQAGAPAVVAPAAQSAVSAPAQMAHLPWTRNTNIYEVNLRQYTKEGTINAFATHLPALKKMGVDIVWLMPIHPIGEHNRKGGLGSYYAVRDYKGVNPDYGTLDDLRAMVKQAHGLGMHVILDWVANHTAWDNAWATEHPDWYKKNAKGEIYSVTFTNEAGGVEEWTDVIGLDFKQKGLWQGMTDAMAYWVREADIDGFRCDAAGLVPTPFWNQARAELDKIKPMFMLAEWSTPDLHEKAFDMTYAWDFSDVIKKVAKGKGDARDLKQYIDAPPKVFPRDAYRMLFTNNHDLNSWDDTDAGLYGPAYKAMAMLTFTLPGMPLIYGGQEAGLDKKLAFFEKDAIDWKSRELVGFYADLIRLKKRNPALWNGQYGGTVTVLETGSDKVFAFKRSLGKNLVSVAVNLSGEERRIKLPGSKATIALKPWAWHIAESNK